MPRQSEIVSTTMIDLVVEAIAAVGCTEFQVDPAKYRRLALAAFGSLGKLTKAMVDAVQSAS